MPNPRDRRTSYRSQFIQVPTSLLTNELRDQHAPVARIHVEEGPDMQFAPLVLPFCRTREPRFHRLSPPSRRNGPGGFASYVTASIALFY